MTRTIKVVVERLAVTEVEVEIPRECPACGEAFTAETGALREDGFTAVSWGAYITDDARENDGSYEDCSDGFITTGYHCRCGHFLISEEIDRKAVR